MVRPVGAKSSLSLCRGHIASAPWTGAIRYHDAIHRRAAAKKPGALYPSGFANRRTQFSAREHFAIFSLAWFTVARLNSPRIAGGRHADPADRRDQ